MTPAFVQVGQARGLRRPPRPPAPLIICIGNPDRGDDAAGLLVAHNLGRRGIAAIEHTGDALSLIDMWQGRDDVLIVDAVVSGKHPGTVSILDASLPLSRTPAASSHGLSLAHAIALARTLGKLPPHLALYGIEACRFDPGEPPSKAVCRGAARAARKIYEYCTDSRMPAV